MSVLGLRTRRVAVETKEGRVMHKMEVLWQSFEGGNLIDLSGSNFKVVVDRGGEGSPIVSLVEESKLSDLKTKNTNVSGGGQDGEGSAEEGSSCRHKQDTRKKVVPGEESRLQRKAMGDGVRSS